MALAQSLPAVCFPFLIICFLNFAQTRAWHFERDNRLLAYDPTNDSEVDFLKDFADDVGGLAITGAAIDGLFGAMSVPEKTPLGAAAVGSVLGGLIGETIGTTVFTIKKVDCAYKKQNCEPKLLACVRFESPMGWACCVENFRRKCVTVSELEAMFSTTTTTTAPTTTASATATPAPFSGQQFFPTWHESFVYGNNSEGRRFPHHVCLRGRKTTTTFVLTGNKCLFDARGCVFIFCYDVKFGTQHFSAWACDPNDRRIDTCRKLYPKGYNPTDWKCTCKVCSFEEREMCNESITFEEHYNRTKNSLK